MAQAEGQERRYYIGGRWYSPDISTPLCRYEGIFERVMLYQSPKGTFFTVRESTVDSLGTEGTAVEVLDKSAALSFMDKHNDGIYTENYIRIFGEPAQG